MGTNWIETSKGRFTHAYIMGLFAEECKNGKYIVCMTTPNGYRRLSCELVTKDKFVKYDLAI